MSNLETLNPPTTATPIRGQALIFWDSKKPGHKLDAIDTDQITPSEDCVSESLETLDKRWIEGAFRHLMPDFRQRVHSGQTFLIAGERFAIGSSREMSPAGLKAIAAEVGREMVILCSRNMGDIFRRNALNLGLHVVQCPEAVQDAKDGDELEFEPVSRSLKNLTQDKVYEPIALTAQEDNIRKSGGVFEMGRNLFRKSHPSMPALEWPSAEQAKKMTTTQQILWAHRQDRSAKVAAGETLAVYGDLFPVSDGTAPFAIYTYQQITEQKAPPQRAAIISDHFVYTNRDGDNKQTEISRSFAEALNIRKPYYATPGDGIFHFYLPEQGLIVPGGIYPGADSHSRAYGAYGAIGIGVGSTTSGFGWSLGYIYLTLAKSRRVRIEGQLQPWVSGKDIVLSLLRRWGAQQAQGMSVEFVDTETQLPMVYRNTICNMMAEAEAQNGIFAPDAITRGWFEERGIAMPYPAIAPGEDAHYEIDEVLNLSEIAPLIAKPFAPGNAHSAEEVAKEKLTFNKAYIGSCTNGSYEDLLQAALVLQAAAKTGLEKKAAGIDFVIFPGSGQVASKIKQPDHRLGGRSIADVLTGAGAEIRASWCGPCFGQGPDSLEPGQRAITTFNRNWQNRMGVGGEGYLASPAVVAASALAGFMAPPSELGITWDPATYC